MSTHLIGHIVKATIHDNPQTNRDNAEFIKGKLAVTGNANLVAQGVLVNTKFLLVKAAITLDHDSIEAAHNAKTDLHKQNKDVVKSINNSAAVMEQEHPPPK